MITERERYLGSLAGLAVGDAVGTTVEFKRPGTFEPVIDMTGGGPFRLEPGQWTDDTSMALCLAESLTERKGFDARDQMERYVRWKNEGHLASNGRCFDIGLTVSRALEEYEANGDPLAGSADPRSAGNGSLMRLAPVPLFFVREPSKAVRLSGESSRTTHAAAACIDACRYFGGLIAAASRGAPKDELLAPLFTPSPGEWERIPLCPEIKEIALGSFKDKNPPGIAGTGYVVRSLEAALWAFHNSGNFRDGCLLAANLGDDADTTAAIYGQVAGAHYGLDGIPQAWQERLALRDLILGLAAALYDGRP